MAKFGFIGPCRGDAKVMHPPAERLLFEHHVDRVVYLGADDALDRAIGGWAERLGAPKSEEDFLDEIALIALDAPPEALMDLLARDKQSRRLGDLAALPAPPSRAVELIGDRVLLMVFDKGVLDEEDVANATLIVWGNAREPQLRAIGPRVFLSPGWLGLGTPGHSALVECTEETLYCAIFDEDGAVKLEHRVALARGGKVGVSAP
ncbi:MAG: hypothetical protein Q8Q09_03950 [Deltaproteobacteria bacterium]|nr:hypothetical protein [Deltaproteobacteria bacterium]